MDTVASARALLLLSAANFAPWAAQKMFGRHWAAPMDLGCVLWDGNRLFGSHKTWRGLIAGTVASAMAAEGSGLSWAIGAGFGTASLLGDALSSSIKRRLALAPGTEVAGLDQLPEAVLPLMVFAPALNVGMAEIIAAAGVFLSLNLLMIRLR